MFPVLLLSGVMMSLCVVRLYLTFCRATLVCSIAAASVEALILTNALNLRDIRIYSAFTLPNLWARITITIPLAHQLHCTPNAFAAVVCGFVAHWHLAGRRGRAQPPAYAARTALEGCCWVSVNLPAGGTL